MASNAENMGRAINRADGPYVRAAEDAQHRLPKELQMQGSRINGRPGPNLRITRADLDAKIKAVAVREAKRAARREVKRHKPEIKAAAATEALQKSANAEHLRRLMAARSAPQADAISVLARRFAATTDPVEKSALGERLTYERLRRMIARRGR